MLRSVKRLQLDSSRWLLILKTILGVLFILAGMGKLTAQAEFVSEVTGYGLLSPGLAGAYASVLPWVELITGLALITSLFTVPALVLSILMTMSFLSANIFILAHGDATQCNCFGHLIPLSHTASLVIDCVMLATAGLLLRLRRKVFSLPTGDLLARVSWRGSALAERFPQQVLNASLLAVMVLVFGLPASFIDVRSPVQKEMDEALAAGRPVVLAFYLDGCGECAQEKEVLDELAQTYGEWIAFIRADFSKETRLAGNFEVYRVPASVVLTGTQETPQVLEKTTGLVSKDRFLDVFYEQIRVPFWQHFGPMAGFTADPVTGDVPIKINFKDISRGVVEAWGWDFDSDGTIDSTLQNPSHIFLQPGSYDVTLSVNGTFGASVITQTSLLEFTFTRGEADFTASPMEFTDANAPVQFRDTSKGSVLEWAWDLNGDGVIDSTEQDPSYVYGSPGHYAVTLTIGGPFGTDSIRKEDFIHVINTATVANFSASKTEVEGGNTPVRFYDKSEGDITFWEWDFDGDGVTDSQDQNPDFVYTEDGIYSVTLTVKTDYGEDTLTLHDYVTVRGCST